MDNLTGLPWGPSLAFAARVNQCHEGACLQALGLFSAVVCLLQLSDRDLYSFIPLKARIFRKIHLTLF